MSSSNGLFSIFRKNKKKKLEFLITDTEGLENDIGYAVYVKERPSETTAAPPSQRLQQRCVLFALISKGKQFNSKGYTHVVAVCHSALPLQDFAIDNFTDAKVISGFFSLNEAEKAYALYGPAYLLGERITWSQIRRTH